MSKIAQKLVEVMRSCGYVQKQGQNEFHKYSYATAADVLKNINAALVKQQIATVAVPELIDFRDTVNLKGQTEHMATVKTTLTLIDAESGESLSFVGLGSGKDSGDKAIMKAQTASIKYAYLLSLAISTGDDPEADFGVDERNNPAPLPIVTHEELKSPALRCTACNASITPGVARVSTQKYGKTLCMKCQAKNNVA